MWCGPARDRRHPLASVSILAPAPGNGPYTETEFRGKGGSGLEAKYWTQHLDDVLPGRVDKPRIGGLTMVIDKGFPITSMRDVLQLAADHIDFWKFGFGSASVCPPERIMDKVMLCQEYGVMAYPGGTSLEIAILQGRWKEYLESLAEGVCGSSRYRTAR